ncbi:hypothetical protein [Halopseudomonas bauzanensis]|uniref:Uncharacterized protein n=1 Tax=Halopseudomonas bauzanensis TaxID=653930 RepID=A0A4U0YN04_9GAMM|nr:hypothetical protein [Halopseudomonas bauzanensis]TKA90373.1 hypothetical protein FA869_14745 [Halopseudomonas bauzanensis]
MEKSDLGLVARYLLAPGVFVVGASMASLVMSVSLVMNYVLAGGLVWLSGACGVLVWVLRGRERAEG